MVKTIEIVSLSSGLLGEPMDGEFHEEYKKALLDVTGGGLPILCNVSVGHAQPRCIVPFGVTATVDAQRQVISFDAK